MSIQSNDFSAEDEQEQANQLDKQESELPAPPSKLPFDVEDSTLPAEETGMSSIPKAPLESELPPEARGEANGGPLGCCLGTVSGLLLTFLLTTIVSISLANGGFLGGATLPIALLGAVLGGYFGWKIGKKIYTEYDPPAIKERKYQARTKPKRI